MVYFVDSTFSSRQIHTAAIIAESTRFNARQRSVCKVLVHIVKLSGLKIRTSWCNRQVIGLLIKLKLSTIQETAVNPSYNLPLAGNRRLSFPKVAQDRELYFFTIIFIFEVDCHFCSTHELEFTADSNELLFIQVSAEDSKFSVQ